MYSICRMYRFSRCSGARGAYVRTRLKDIPSRLSVDRMKLPWGLHTPFPSSFAGDPALLSTPMELPPLLMVALAIERLNLRGLAGVLTMSAVPAGVCG